jgi:hypothetical protein
VVLPALSEDAFGREGVAEADVGVAAAVVVVVDSDPLIGVSLSSWRPAADAIIILSMLNLFPRLSFSIWTPNGFLSQERCPRFAPMLAKDCNGVGRKEFPLLDKY